VRTGFDDCGGAKAVGGREYGNAVCLAFLLTIAGADAARAGEADTAAQGVCRQFEGAGELPVDFRKIASSLVPTMDAKQRRDKTWYSDGSCVCSNVLPGVDDRAFPGHDDKLISGATYSCVAAQDYVASAKKRGWN
jgi:hypothetical protein